MEVILATIFLFFSMAYHPSCTGVWPGLLLPQVGNRPLNSQKGESSTPWRRRNLTPPATSHRSFPELQKGNQHQTHSSKRHFFSLKDIQRWDLWPSCAIEELCTTTARGTTTLWADWTSVGNSSSWLFTHFKYLQTYRAPSSAAGKPSYTYLSHLIFPHKSISQVNLSTP